MADLIALGCVGAAILLTYVHLALIARRALLARQAKRELEQMGRDWEAGR